MKGSCVDISFYWLFVIIIASLFLGMYLDNRSENFKICIENKLPNCMEIIK